MGKTAGRITAWGFALSVTAGLAFPMTATAAEEPNPTLSGDCAATLQNGKSADGLVLDAGAPLNSPEALTVGLDSKAKTAEGRKPLLSLPVGDLVKTTGLTDNAVGDLAAQGVCKPAQGTVNAVGALTQGAVDELPIPDPEPEPEPPNPEPKPPTPGPGPGPGQPGGPGSELPVQTGPGSSTGIGGDSIAGLISNAALLPGSFVQAPVITEIIPGEVPPPTVDEKDAGNAQAIQAPVAPAKLPLLLAVLALAVVAAALVRAWLRGKPA
ncbi:hypothetical protein SAMN04489729_5034 [Amycolatopsis lurida]|uniref:Uncharacterized protein n=1 Tax=Amycolatopsis lurida NRRL 2430 TaxID=1460371 RepID=A0A2P2FR04_AMYLU|nr:hypothetical protein [Amycolatopsis lurida]KFU79110.1 hypothetical protein BB31_22495 [Amycolatopsis lurida NRRL 2430]SED71783.1 hypothetical protein SAMN04489729_5034 [Amycolatopsis lurida]